MITQNGRQVGAIGLFQIDASAKFERYENSGVIPDKPATPVLDFDTNGIVQGHVERLERQSDPRNGEAHHHFPRLREYYRGCREERVDLEGRAADPRRHRVSLRAEVG